MVFTIGNFWVDLTRSTLYVLLPLSIILAIVLTGEGVIQNFKTCETALTLQGAKQIIPMGPVASQIAIKQLGTNGGGFFNSNSSHPFENPTPFSNFLEMHAILYIILTVFIAGLMVWRTHEYMGKKITPLSSGIFRTDNWLFIGLLV
jgi:potassium-transporting ATPase potassium-binding subunit